MEIKVDPANMTREQREAVAGFILAYPGKVCAGTCDKKVGTLALDVTMNTEKAKAAITDLAEHARAANLQPDPEIAQLAKEDSEFDANLAFGQTLAYNDPPGSDPVVVRAFGSAPAPLPHGATAAPFTAGVVPLPTVPVDMPVTTLTVPFAVPLPPVPPVPVTVAPTVSVAAPTNPVDLDKTGIPWDHRIHAESKAKIADGTWRAKRNCDPALKATVEAELRQLMGVAPSVPLPPSVAPPVGPVTIHTPPMLATPTPTVAVNVIPAAPSAAPIDPKLQFVQLVGRASAAIQAKKITLQEVSEICAAAGVPALPLLANRLDLVPDVAAKIDALIGGR